MTQYLYKKGGICRTYCHVIKRTGIVDGKIHTVGRNRSTYEELEDPALPIIPQIRYKLLHRHGKHILPEKY